MLTYRSFRNADPPILTALWRSRAGRPGFMDPVSPDLLEQLVFAKLYFDYAGLILAFQDGLPVGFAHAGFGPNEQLSAVSFDLGVTSIVIVRPDCAEGEVAAGLLEKCEQYLRAKGAKVLYGGGIQPLNPFYLGLYGGSELPGVLDSDPEVRNLFQSHDYQEIERTRIAQVDLSRFEAVIDRSQMQIRRQMVVEETIDFPTRNWWEACTLGEFDLTRFEMVPRVRRTRRGTRYFPKHGSGRGQFFGPAVRLDRISRRSRLSPPRLRRFFTQRSLPAVYATGHYNHRGPNHGKQCSGHQPLSKTGLQANRRRKSVSERMMMDENGMMNSE